MSNYSRIDKETEKHLTRLLSWLIDEVLSSGGDGDGIWYSKFYSVEDIRKVIEFNNLLPKGWHFHSEFYDSFSIGAEMEGLLITNNKERFESRPSWQQIAIVN